MKIRIIKKRIKKLECKIFKRQALSSLRLLIVWNKLNHPNSKLNMKILTNNFFRNGNFINNGHW